MKIAILTNFAEINPWHSLSGIVEDQAEMLADHGHEVEVFVQEGFSSTEAPNCFPVIPRVALTDYESRQEVSREHQEYAEKLADLLVMSLSDVDFALTHDWVFTGWNLPYALAVRRASPRLPGLKWLHWIHSIPTFGRDWWRIREYGPGHRLVYPNESDRVRVAEQYQGGLEHVTAIPHIKDPRTWFGFSAETNDFIRRFPAALQADVVQVLPASSDRLSAKRVEEVIKIFGRFKARGQSVGLVVANQWMAGRDFREVLGPYIDLAEAEGLTPGVDFIFTSELGPEYENGISRRMLRELWCLANLFIFPTREETFGLVVPEAAAAGMLPVFNRSLTMQMEIAGGHESAVWMEFGSFERRVRYPNKDEWLDSAAGLIYAEMQRDRAVRLKTFCRQRYNRDAIYRRHYQPILAEKMIPPGGALSRRTAEAGSRDNQRYHWVTARAAEAVFRGAEALEVGPGDGTFAGGMRSAGFSVRTVDLPGAGRPDWTLDITRNFVDQKFDLIHCGQVLEHVPDDRAALANIRRMCKPETLVLISAANFPDPEHVRTYTEAGFRTLVEEAGFDILEARQFRGNGRACFAAACKIKKERSAPVNPDAVYDFSHWPELPLVSCQCLTYARPALLAEAVESFLRQDYPGPKELIVLNDQPEAIYYAGLPGVRVVNLPERVPTVGGKRNLCAELSAGEILLPWDDDDIHLPWRISVTIAEMTNHHFFKAKRMWFLQEEPKWTFKLSNQSVAPSMAGFSKSLWEDVGRYPEMQSGQDMEFHKKIRPTGLQDVHPLPATLVYYLYRWGTGHYHLSGYGRGQKGFEAIGRRAAASPRGEIEIEPTWRRDYVGLVKDFLAEINEQPGG